jgi:hypothetical protein
MSGISTKPPRNTLNTTVALDGKKKKTDVQLFFCLI